MAICQSTTTGSRTVSARLPSAVKIGYSQDRFAPDNVPRLDVSGEGRGSNTLTGSFTDYALPRADTVPFFAMGYHSVPAKTNVLGAKGCGEAGCAGSLPSVMNAIVDALGGKHVNMPATPERVWEALNS